jgi:septum formation protein
VARPLDLYLASKSPRRRQLLTEAGISFLLCEPGEEYVDAACEHEGEVGEPRELAQSRARRKAFGARPDGDSVPVLAVDTVVDLQGCELGKASDRHAAQGYLKRLAGREHRVHTAHCLVVPGRGEQAFEELASSTVVARMPTEDQIARYLDSEQWRGKAGGYGIQDPAQDFLELVDGHFDTVVGLHVAAVQRLLMAFGEGQ